MSETPSAGETVITAEYLAKIQQLLDHLHDFRYLLSHPYAEHLSMSEHTGEGVAKQLRHVLLAAIEALSPGPGVSFRTPRARVYNVLHLHYVEGMTISEAATELNISPRQAYRDLRRGEESVAAMLWEQLEAGNLGTHHEQMHAQALEDEMHHIVQHSTLVNVLFSVQRALKSVECLAQNSDITLRLELPVEPASMVADAMLMQQLLVSLFSHAIQEAKIGELQLSLHKQGIYFSLSMHYEAKHGTLPKLDSTILQLTERLGWQEPCVTDHSSERIVLLRMPIGGVTLLVVDDNANLIELFERYLAGLPCHLVQAITSIEGIKLAEELHPDAIVLDVMMPETDGWQVLQILKNNTETAAIPVIICSVISDPLLAESLGAAAILAKPVSRDDLISALQHLALI